MKSLHVAWQGAEQWVHRYNALLAAGLANADAQTMRGELDALFSEILDGLKDQGRANALRHRRTNGVTPTDIVDDMSLLYRWIGSR